MYTNLTSYAIQINRSNFNNSLEINADFELTLFSKAKFEKEGGVIMALSTGQDVCIGVIDVGSPKSGNLGWAIRKGEQKSHGDDFDEFIAEFAKQCDGCPAALGFEAPLFVPIRDKAHELTNARKGEGGRPWSASAGATVLTVALPVVTYTLSKLCTRIEGYEASLDWKSWGAGANELLVWEAFVSGSSKGDDHWHDADIAAGAFHYGLDNLDAINAIEEPEVLSLVGAALIHSGWAEASVSILKTPALVVKP
jgi:hypothetical protein